MIHGDSCFHLVSSKNYPQTEELVSEIEKDSSKYEKPNELPVPTVGNNNPRYAV